ncbi:hypothetical protein ACVWZR_003121 [Bradyrhizobium sp. i1.3.1]
MPGTVTEPRVNVTWPPDAAFTPTSPPPLPTDKLRSVAVIELLVPVADKPVFPPPPANVMLLPLASWILPPFCAVAAVMPPEAPMFTERPLAMIWLVAPSAVINLPKPPLRLIDEPGVN